MKPASRPTRFLLLILLLGTLASAPLAWAQYYGGAYVDNQAATAGESYSRGMSDVIRSKGEYNLTTSQAAINMTEAQKNDIQNQQLYANTYFDMRKANDAYRTSERGPRPTTEDFVRYAQMGKPKPLSPSQMDTVSGRMSWPVLLNTDQFTQGRQQIEDLMVKRSTFGGLGFEDQMKVRDTVNTMLASLKEQIKSVPPAYYMTSKRFLESLAYDVQKPLG